MEDRIRLSYFYGKEADQFSFYKIPKLLFTEEYFKKISVEAKVLYGLMLDRMSLSMKNQWMDDEGRAYIYYSLEDIMEALGCSNKKAISIMKELDTDAGIGLIEKKRQGQGKPTMIYLKQFMVQDVQKCRNYTSFSYVAGWSEGKKTPELKASLDKIRQTALEFIYQIDQKIEVLMADKGQVQESAKTSSPFTQELMEKITEGAKNLGFIPVVPEAQEKNANPELKVVVDKALKDLDKKRTLSKVKESVKSKLKSNTEKAEQAPKKSRTSKVKEKRA